MANIVAVPTKNVGDVFTSTMWNESIRDNINNGIVNQIAAQVARTGDKSIADSTVTAIDFTSPAALDTDGMWDSADPTKVTIQTAGVYMITGHVNFAANGTGVRTSRLRINGTTEIAQDVENAPSAGQTCRLNPCALHDLAVADYVELVVSQTSGAGLNANSTAEYGNVLRVARL